MVLVSPHSNRNRSKTEIGTQDWGISVTGLTIFLGLKIRKAVECFKGFLTGHNSRSMGDSGAEDDLNCEELTQEVSEENNVSMWPRDSYCDISEKDGAAFCPCLKC